MPARLMVQTDATGHAAADALLLIGRGPRLLEDDVLELIPPSVGEAVWRQMVRKTDGGDAGRVATTWTGPPSRSVAARAVSDARPAAGFLFLKATRRVCALRVSSAPLRRDDRVTAPENAESPAVAGDLTGGRTRT